VTRVAIVDLFVVDIAFFSLYILSAVLVLIAYCYIKSLASFV
jgi:hypothetical protein